MSDVDELPKGLERGCRYLADRLEDLLNMMVNRNDRLRQQFEAAHRANIRRQPKIEVRISFQPEGKKLEETPKFYKPLRQALINIAFDNSDYQRAIAVFEEIAREFPCFSHRIVVIGEPVVQATLVVITPPTFDEQLSDHDRELMQAIFRGNGG